MNVSTNIKLSQVSSDKPLCCSTPKRNQFLTVKKFSQGQEQEEFRQGPGQEEFSQEQEENSRGQEQEEFSQGQEQDEISQGQEQEEFSQEQEEISQGQEQEDFSQGQKQDFSLGQEQVQDRPRESGKAEVALDHVVNTPLFAEITALCQVQILQYQS